MNPTSAPRREDTSLFLSYAVSLGFIYACITAFVALNVAGGGHGWNSVMLSACGLLIIPLASAAWARRFRRVGKIMGGAALGSAALVDVFIVIFTLQEGLEYVVRVSNAAPFLVICWVVLWIGWQIIFVVTVCRLKGKRAH